MVSNGKQMVALPTEGRSRIMRANKSKNSRPELILRTTLWHAGFRGYRLHYSRLPGKPDVSFVSKRVAVFVHGCFWHRCPACNYKLPRTNREFWKAKFRRNRSRDRQNIRDLEELGWTVVTVWECEVLNDLPTIIRKIRRVLSKSA
jgi:DNA mismatch endonuclease (patch repair protein)